MQSVSLLLLFPLQHEFDLFPITLLLHFNIMFIVPGNCLATDVKSVIKQLEEACFHFLHSIKVNGSPLFEGKGHDLILKWEEAK